MANPPPDPADLSDQFSISSTFLSSNLTSLFRYAETLQYIEAPLYSLIGYIHFVLQLTLHPPTDSVVFCYPQNILFPTRFIEEIGLNSFKYFIPDFGFQMARVRTLVIDLETVVWIVEVKRLTGEKNAEGCQRLSWSAAEASVFAQDRFQDSLTQIFQQAICAFYCYPSQQHLHYFFWCGCFFTLLVFDQPEDVVAVLDNKGICVTKNQDMDDPFTTNNPIDEDTILQLLFPPDKVARVDVKFFTEPIFDDLTATTNTVLSEYLRAALKIPLDFYNIAYQGNPLFRLSRAVYQPDQDVIGAAMEIIKKWKKTTVVDLDEKASVIASLDHLKHTSVYEESPHRNPKTDSPISTPGPKQTPFTASKSMRNMTLGTGRQKFHRAVKRPRTDSEEEEEEIVAQPRTPPRPSGSGQRF